MVFELFSYRCKYKSSFFYKKIKIQEAQTSRRLSFLTISIGFL